jgi:protein-disulfide isomerase
MTLFSRRGALAVAGTTIALTLGAGIPSAAVAQTSPGLPDLVYGGAFYTNVLPHLQKTYIDTGKVRFVYRDFPLDDLAVGAAMLARCSKDKRGAMIGALYKTQATWLSDKANPLEELYKVGRQFGMKQDEMEKCLADEAAAKAILTDAEAFEKAVKIEGTPTFMVNGKKFDKAPTIEGFDAYLKPLVK